MSFEYHYNNVTKDKIEIDAIYKEKDRKQK